MLKSALYAQAPEAAAGFMGQFIAVREARYARFPDCRYSETYEERSEGTARYVEQALMLREEVSPQPGGQAALLARHLDWFPDVDNMSKSRYYATGAAQGLVLDRAGRGDWKDLVAAGDSPYDVTVRAFAPQDAAAALAAAKAGHGYEALLAEGLQKASAFQTAKAAAIAAYNALPGLEWSVPTARSMGYSAASPSYKLSDAETLMPTTYMVDIKAEGYAFNLTNRPVVRGDGELRFHAAAPAITLDGRPFTAAEGTHPFDSLLLSEAGLEMSVSRPGTLSVAGGKAVITLR